MYIGQSTLSRQISSLEDELGFLLFIRGSKSLQLTQAGQVLYEEGLGLVEHLESVREKTITAGRQSCGMVEVVSVPAYFEAFHDIYIAVNSICKDISVRLTHQRFETICPDVDVGKANAGLIYDFLMPRCCALAAEPVMRERFSVLCSVDHPLSKRKKVRLDELDEAEILFGKEGVDSVRRFNRTGIFQQAPYAISTHGFENMVLDIKSNYGIAILPSSEISFHNSSVAGVPLADEDLEFNVLMVYKREHLSQKMKRFIEVVNMILEAQRCV
jgi:DNA-binding transcriptional LysR family regulator